MTLRDAQHSQRPRLRKGLTLTALAAGLAGSLAAGSAGVLEIADGVVLPYPATWAEVPSGYANRLELVRQAGAESSVAPDVRLSAWAEPRLDFDDALKRLREIAAESDAPVTVLEIAGWPAIQRRDRRPLARTGATAPESVEDLPLHLTTAIAYGATLVRFEGRVDARHLPAPDDDLVEEIESLTCRVLLDRGADPERTRRELDALRRALSAPPVSEQ